MIRFLLWMVLQSFEEQVPLRNTINQNYEK